MDIEQYIKSVNPQTIESNNGVAYELIKHLDSYLDEFLIHNLAYSDKLPDITHGYVSYWDCTDTRVGYGLYYFRYKPVCITKTLCRKCETNLFWLGEKLQRDILHYVLSKIEYEDEKVFAEKEIDLVDLNGLYLKEGYNGRR